MSPAPYTETETDISIMKHNAVAIMHRTAPPASQQASPRARRPSPSSTQSTRLASPRPSAIEAPLHVVRPLSSSSSSPSPSPSPPPASSSLAIGRRKHRCQSPIAIILRRQTPPARHTQAKADRGAKRTASVAAFLSYSSCEEDQHSTHHPSSHPHHIPPPGAISLILFPTVPPSPHPDPRHKPLHPSFPHQHRRA
ncbi:hypothetical protein DFH27DRAFT_607625 [Peziza echinospora]|nr:hypothetical protein DFH27DRAFT_607625 [Peziza echinospora]